MKKQNVAGKTITLKIKYSDFSVNTRSKTLPDYFNDTKSIFLNSKNLLYQQNLANSVRLLGVSVSNLNNQSQKQKKQPEYIQLKIPFTEYE